MIPGENIPAAYGDRKPCQHCQVEMIQCPNGIWIHLGRHRYENSRPCPPTTVATP